LALTRESPTGGGPPAARDRASAGKPFALGSPHKRALASEGREARYRKRFM